MKPYTIPSQAILTRCLILLTSCSTTMAFTSTPIAPMSVYYSSSASRRSAAAAAATVLHATLTADELSTMSKDEQLKVLGVDTEEKLALGIDPDEVLEFLGTWVLLFSDMCKCGAVQQRCVAVRSPLVFDLPLSPYDRTCLWILPSSYPSSSTSCILSLSLHHAWNSSSYWNLHM